MDARFPTYWLNDRRVNKATDSQFRLFVNANAWAVTNGTDGHIPESELFLIPRATTADAAALVSLGLWVKVQDGWMIDGYLLVQTSRDQLEGLRATSRKTSKTYREKKKAECASSPKGDVTHHVTGDAPQHVIDDVTTKARKGKSKALYGSEAKSRVSEETWSSEELNQTAGELEPKDGTVTPITVPARLNTAPAAETVATCPDCSDPINAAGICSFCGPRREAMTW